MTPSSLPETRTLMSHATKGFASMDPERHRALARLGGKKAHALGTAHQWTTEEATIAGRKGGSAKRRPGCRGAAKRAS